MDTLPAEVEIDEALVARLVSTQHPSLVGEVRWVSSGWDNILFRLGGDYVVRMPRRAAAFTLIEHEQRWLPELQKLVVVPVPVPFAIGVPSEDFAGPWSIARWIDGVPAASLPLAGRDGLVDPLADFVCELHVHAAVGAPVNPFRGVPLASRDEIVRARLGSGLIPHAEALLEIWERALVAPVYDGAPLWMHGDLHPINVLVAPSGTLAAVLDFGDLGQGDPACDLAAAWLFFDTAQRDRFRAGIGEGVHDGAAWVRAEGWAVAIAAAILPNTALTPIAQHAIAQLASDL